MSHQMELKFAKVCHVDKPDTERDGLQINRWRGENLKCKRGIIEGEVAVRDMASISLA
jgi:hypothetical protein